MSEPTTELTLNQRIAQWKASLKAAELHALAAEVKAAKLEVELEKAEAALRNMARSHASERARAERAEAQLRSLGVKVGKAA